MKPLSSMPFCLVSYKCFESDPSQARSSSLPFLPQNPFLPTPISAKSHMISSGQKPAQEGITGGKKQLFDFWQ